ncbi:hypothetical protein [Deinococcus cellulosilyticus]|uniref:Uncharacterized protein n=1 Tax=Deinococcus cellulosilyticus (strain DSM 18568 / NBRC 106333 / KACC 11606 / 5516J-15) TaxID=1223518 RepID=A0A511NC35_DEIC1|nr:hypothetical protein [Deinococcus cellulosilyticus]GEM49931.1 hypothetical protein DC3_55660 [Deinococcus cellulosilyticus NBRC 106333 = KACC 11606]
MDDFSLLLVLVNLLVWVPVVVLLRPSGAQDQSLQQWKKQLDRWSQLKHRNEEWRDR